MDPVSPIRHIIKRNGTIVAYDRQRIANAIQKAMLAVRKPDPAAADALAIQVEASLGESYGARMMPSVEDVQDVVESVLIRNGLVDLAREYIIYRHQHTQARTGRAYTFDVHDNIPYRKLYEVLRWNLDHGCASVEALNSTIASGRYPDLVQQADARYDQEIALAADRILQERGKIRVVIVAGPSASGKTTTTIKVGERLAAAGLRLRTINIDHYFFDLVKHPRDEFGDYDYEAPAALDIALINEHLAALLEGRTVRAPNYDFKTGVRTLNVHEVKLERGDILLLDSLHGLFGGMTESVPAERKFKLYIETLGQFRARDGTYMRWADNRLLRRMIRDMHHRNSQPIETLTHWHYVRRSELKHIIPNIRHADCIVNTALPYELPILRKHLFRLISGVVHRYQGDPKRLDAHIRANRVHDLLKPLRAVKDETCIPGKSLLREFIGGSGYAY